MLNLVANGPSGYNINNSLRFRASASAYLNRTPASAGNRKTWTWSAWIKRGTLGVNQALFNAGTGTTDATWSGIWLDGNNALEIGGYTNTWRVTSQVFRDPSSWYHIVVVMDTTQATATDRVKLYVNGSQVTSFGTTVNPTQNTDLGINQAAIHDIGYQTTSVSLGYFDGYMAEVNFVDGTALTPSSFGSTNATTGVWQPAQYTGTYGTNGFYLKFSDIATTSGSNAGLGKDFSGNANYWTTNNISVTAGTTYDAMTDSPTLTSATVANYCTLNPLLRSYSSITNANTTMTTTGGAGSNQWTLSSGTQFPTSGKWYFEVYINTKTADAGGSSIGVGIQSNQAAATYPLNNYLGQQTTGEYNYQAHGYTFFNNVQSGTAVWASYTTGDTIGVAFDLDGLTCYWYKNNTLQGSTSLLSGYGYAPAFSIYQASQATINCGQRPFTYTPPSGYLALNTYNLPDSTIKKGNTVMDATLYTGNGTSQSITNASAFKPDFVWIKCRSTALSNSLYDSVRGVRNTLSSNSTNAENLESAGYSMTAFNSNGFSVGLDNVGIGSVNANTATYVGWQWQAGQGTNTTNTAGSITSTVSVNATAGFSVVTYTGTGANATVGHGLGVAPKMIIAKARSTTNNWPVYHVVLGASNAVRLDLTLASQAGTQWNTAPTSSVFGVGTASETNQSTITYVAYCWAEIAGFSKFGSYTGNGSADGTFIFTNFQPRYIMFKRTDTTSNWNIYDGARNTYNATDILIAANNANADASPYPVDFLSNGIKLRSTLADINASGGTYIYACFASNPFKNSNAR